MKEYISEALTVKFFFLAPYVENNSKLYNGKTKSNTERCRERNCKCYQHSDLWSMLRRAAQNTSYNLEIPLSSILFYRL